MLKGYQIKEKIRDGSVGTVWKALSPKGETVAIKRIFRKNADVAKKLKQFRHEATLTARLDHPSIIKVHEFVDLPPQPFIVMEYFDSENLKFCIQQAPKRIDGMEFGILRQAAEALAYIHSKNIIHKDLKPDNILVSTGSDVRLIDFSLGETKMDRLLQFGRKTEGSPLYMAPEQIRGQKCDTRSDIYALGVVMYEVITKVPPFTAPSMELIFQKHLQEVPVPLSQKVPAISSEMNEIVLRMLSKKRENRPQDLTMVLHELLKWEKKLLPVRKSQVLPCPEPGSPELDPDADPEEYYDPDKVSKPDTQQENG